jgi:hypothetical protein
MAKKRKQKTGNQDVWTPEEIVQVIEEMIKDAIANPTVNTLLSVCVRADINSDNISFWEKKFEDNSLVVGSIKKLRALMESRLLERALNNEINAGFTKFLLKSKMGYTEEQSNITIIKGDTITVKFDDDVNTEDTTEDNE